ncbi:hypothetical protein [Acinetobacter pittii]|uniref:hypothetical protein n=1 Tax=Acinetobacter pittii TaxID=48296 RepID=UPI0002D875AE|nr:hypothetical protein [Acinetobacter pittii]MCM5533146.1 hypothetical protein [Acinetobacter pittii]MCQ9383101.1 hypothetical protein [Acinetobacter pittii]MCR3926033.1 hypothetical protein [Acinetobacter pittii]RZH25139.1 hypothetical protein EXD96_18920 [Acinetobacter pittii]
MEKELKKKLYENVACIGLWILVITLAFLFIAKFFFGQCIDISLLKDVLSISTTIFAALVAILMFSDWRVQKQYEIEREKLEMALIDIAEVNKRLVILRNDMNIIKGTWDHYTFYPNILKRDDQNPSDLLNSIYIQLRNYKFLSKDPNIMDKVKTFQSSTNTVFGLKENKLKGLYSEYIQNLYSANLEEKDSNISYEKDYDEDTHRVIRENKFMIKIEFQNELAVDDLDENRNVVATVTKDYISFIKDAIAEVESLTQYCIDKINILR